jgi:hypothetical protein
MEIAIDCTGIDKSCLCASAGRMTTCSDALAVSIVSLEEKSESKPALAPNHDLRTA